MSETAKPKVRLLNITVQPFSDITSSARTCYSSKGIVLPKDVSEDSESNRFMPLVQSIYQAGHHTTFQHTHLQFSLENVSRNFIWSFLHSHPFYNSEQVSQRYVLVKKDQFYYPENLNDQELQLFDECYEYQIKAYKSLRKKLMPLVETEYLKRFKSRKGSKQCTTDVKKKSQEIARYVLPLGTTAYLHHTISFLTLMRYNRLCNSFDVPHEQKIVIQMMMDEVLKADPTIADVLQDPMDLKDTPEYEFMQHFTQSNADQFNKEFDDDLEGGYSKLVDYKVHGEKTLARSIRQVFALSKDSYTDKELIEYVLNSNSNKVLSETMNVNVHSKLMRSLMHVHYTFQKKLSHAADSQDQRHRMTPGSRPVLQSVVSDQADFIIPKLFELDSDLKTLYVDHMETIWEFFRKAKDLGMSFENRSYLLPNSLCLRFYESGDLLALKHKMEMRLCYNAQEEIFFASVDEAQEIFKVHPTIGQFLAPPCKVRSMAKAKPICPEGPRFCGVPVWKLSLDEYSRTI
ncbi:MAG: FAD-dependent thymidylate synthase [Candidatus Cloacimonetes bacterium]|nr:FAD-dependent thymidylate synthase [Candidatus Cloacimonadota bacterium]